MVIKIQVIKNLKTFLPFGTKLLYNQDYISIKKNYKGRERW